jgi:hypothetical protein
MGRGVGVGGKSGFPNGCSLTGRHEWSPAARIQSEQDDSASAKLRACRSFVRLGASVKAEQENIVSFGIVYNSPRTSGNVTSPGILALSDRLSGHRGETSGETEPSLRQQFGRVLGVVSENNAGSRTPD